MLFAAGMVLTAMTSALSAAAVQVPDSGVVETIADDDATRNTVTFHKDIVVHNDVEGTVYGPNVTYSYAIAPFTVTNATVKDADGNSTHVKSGIEEAIATTTNPTAEFTNNDSATISSAPVISKEVSFAFDATKFGTAGIYRYVITEDAAEAGGTDQTQLAALGVTRETEYNAKRYLDVYVSNGDGDTLQITGYVMFHDAVSNGDISFDASSGATTPNTEKKTDGYDADDSSTPTGGGAADPGDMADHYYTENFTLNKTISGALADKTHKFPFTVTVSSATGKSKKFTVKTADASKGQINETTSGTASYDTTLGTDGKLTVSNIAISDGGSIMLYGLPADATVLVTETNDTQDTYQVSISNPNVDAEPVDATGTKAFSAACALSSYGTSDADYTDEPAAGDLGDTNASTFTNTLNSPSPTGVVLAVAPFAIMLGAAAFFIVMFVKNKKKENDASAI